MSRASFPDSIKLLPPIPRKESQERSLEAFISKIASTGNSGQIQEILSHPKVTALLATVFCYSPFLAKIISRYPEFFADICTSGVEDCFAALKTALAQGKYMPVGDLMKTMRVAKSKASLLIALSDIAGVWPLEKVTQAMSEIAELCVQLTLACLLRAAAERKDIRLKHHHDPERESGVFVLAMGKLGAHELNYSSDIDLIVFFDRESVEYTGSSDVQHCLSKIAQEMVRMLQERTAEGYVFRVDLRLRPDPSSTPAAMSVAGAMTYYETVGQNWERAAFIKARAIAGDIVLGNTFLQQIAPFIWRKHLDFAAIADIQSIKRQMDEKTGKRIVLPGHNIKTGIGGIREIEFFAQIHQLIWGGRIPALRLRETCKTLEALADNALIVTDLALKLTESYRYLRAVEHHLQMVDDQQTHTIPTQEEARKQVAEFLGFTEVHAFEQELLRHLEFVHGIFAAAFRGNYSLGGEEGKLSFTGVENDPQTIETLAGMGYRNPASVSEVIQGWHRGSRRATRTKRARELITELTPRLLKAFSATKEPDQAFIHFDEFLARLPAGVQLFSLFNINPQLLNLIAVIMGSAPAMAETLSKKPGMLDVVLTTDFFDEFMDKNALTAEISTALLLAQNFEDEIDTIRRFKNEKQFQAGVQLLTGCADTFTASHYLSDIADVCLEAILGCVEINFKSKESSLKTGNFVLVVLGRLGAQELTFGSDIDIVCVYDTRLHNALLPSRYSLYNKLSQRFVNAVTSLTNEGRLYEVDMRLRPSGGDGALAVGTGALDKYLHESAWTFELMAFTRARAITGNDALREKILGIIKKNITRPRAKELLVQDITHLRSKITKEFGSDDPWNLKYVHGGIIDLDFLAQYFVLLHAHNHPDIIANSSGDIFRNLVRHKLIDEATGYQLVEAHRFFGALFALIRLCGGGVFDENTAPEGLKHSIATILKLPDFSVVKSTLIQTIAAVKHSFYTFIE